MPKLVHANPRYRKHRASGQAIVTLAGKDHYLGLYGSKASRDEYDRLIGEWLANGRETPRAAVGADLYIAELLNAYRKHADSYYAASEGNRHHPSAVGTLERPGAARRQQAVLLLPARSH